MKPKNKSEGYPMIFCKECGLECTKTDFKGFSGLCDHLFLDALALFKKSKASKLVADGDHSGEKECARCQELMRAEPFVDWTNNDVFRGWRCLTCGNVWDPGMADNRSQTRPRGRSTDRAFPGFQLP